MADVWLISGITGAGKSTAAQLLASRAERGAHIQGDWLQRCIVNGGVWPGVEPEAESERQALLNARNQCLLARSFNDAGFLPVLDYFVLKKTHLEAYRQQLDGLDLHFVVLTPGREVILQRDRGRASEHGHIHEPSPRLALVMERELRDSGLWLETSYLTPEETVDEMVRRKADARV